MGRRKQSRPHRSGGIVLGSHGQDKDKLGVDDTHVMDDEQVQKKRLDGGDKPLFVEVDRSCWGLPEHLDISEIVLTDLNLGEELSSGKLGECYDPNLNYSLRFRVCNVNKFLGRIKLGHWPVLPASDVIMELVEKVMLDNGEDNRLILSGKFDGPDEGISGLVHLASLKFLSLRPVPVPLVGFLEEMPRLRLRVEILKNAFDSCESLLDNTKPLWKRSMMNAMAWLRPEVLTSEVRYGIVESTPSAEVDTHHEIDDNSSKPQRHARFDAAAFYEAIKPSKEDPMLDDDLDALVPELRPYQRRAAYWMIQREKEVSEKLDKTEDTQLLSPLCVCVGFIDSNARMFYNPFSGSISMKPEYFSPQVSGGILADEMGLGKTVELLACVLAHRWSASEAHCIESGDGSQVNQDDQICIRRIKRERVECICGAVSESYRYEGLWVQCDICDAWQHSDCVGYSPRGRKIKKPGREEELVMSKVNSKSPRKKNGTSFVEREGKYICQMCLELMRATESPVSSGATLIVCPAPILLQWHAEILRHTKPGSLRVLVYEGVKNSSFSEEPVMDVDDLVTYDIILTTYDVLKEDLSHDSDRHEGDRRFMRFQKRYPVIPTPLTRIFWWRLCLDEAQMVESNAAAATEMALRLNSKHRWCITGTPIQRRFDDLYGLLKFLQISPFDVYRWWSEVIRDPYERKDVGAMRFTNNLFKQFLWRSSKVHVADELHLPPQEECLSWLSFSPIEEHFYQRQHETCVGYARELIKSMKEDILKRETPGDLSSAAPSDPLITHAEAAKLLNSLLKLRQACCHPQVGSSGLRSLHQAPMTMEEILMVLIGKTKIEGEEELRKAVVALNALAGLAILEKNPCQAVSLYKEALDLANEHSEDFSLDPLLNLHIHHNLFEILVNNSSNAQEISLCGGQFTEKIDAHGNKRYYVEEFDGQNVMKRQKTHGDDEINFSSQQVNTCNSAFGQSDDASNGGREGDTKSNMASPSFDYVSLRNVCENLRQKYLSVFNSRLMLAQQEFQKSYEQVCDELNLLKDHGSLWWLESLSHIEESMDSSDDLIKKIGEAVLGSSKNSKSTKIGASFRSISGLKYYIQTGLDSLEAFREQVLDRLLEVDQTMEKPKDEDILRVGHCQICQPNGNGLPCVLCELDDLFQTYAARLFHLKDSGKGVIMSAEEALDLQKKKSALNQFYRTLSHEKKNSTSSSGGKDGEMKGKRDAVDNVLVTRNPSELEIVLRVIRSHCKGQLGREGKSAAAKQLHLLEDMRKEYAVARSLCIAQAQVLRSHDEIRIATSRLRLREDDDDKSLDALCFEELPAHNVQYSNDKMIALAFLSRIRGKLHYLKGLANAKYKSQGDSVSNSFLNQATCATPSPPVDKKREQYHEEACPICQEKLSIQKMVFQCGHMTCMKCLFAMTEYKLAREGNFQKKWLMCPTCRQRTEFANIAYVDDRQDQSCHSGNLPTFQDSGDEASIIVQGSYGTKIEAVTRRILWIKLTDAKAKVLVFSSWNDVLDVLEHAFAANDISFARMKGGRKSHAAISQFKGKKVVGKGDTVSHAEMKSIQVLLLLVQHGANGLNLLEAQHVVLVEPLLNPAVEAQAISRVHRMGQENETLVHRFMVTNTVEESIYKLSRSKTTSTFISGNTKNQDQPMLTLKDVESLFAAAPAMRLDTEAKPDESLRHLPPSMAAAIAAEKRLKEQKSLRIS